MKWLGFDKVSSPYGTRKDPFTGKDTFHAGIDLVKAHKGVINAFTDGVVVYAGEGKTGTGLGGYGNVVFIQDKDGYGHLYAHLDSVTVAIGQRIKEGQGIGRQGNTGKSKGSHLHYEVRKAISPSYGWTSNPAKSTVGPGKYLDGLEKNKGEYKGSSIVDYLVSIDKDSSKENRKKLAIEYGVSGYDFSEKKNLELLEKMRKGVKAPAAPAKPTVKTGSKVKVKKVAKKYATGQNIPEWVKGSSYTVQQVDGNRVLLKEITSWVNKTDLE